MSASSNPVQRSISVNGSAEVRVAPDTVQLLLAVETWDKTVAKAKAANDERTKKTLAVAGRLGIEGKNLQTDRITIEPRFDNSSYAARTEPDGYTVHRSVVMTLKDMKRFEELLAAVLEAGTNRVEGLEFQTTELRTHRDAARAMALKAAREKATAMATELGLKVGKPITISEGYGGAGLWGYGGRGNAMAQNVMQQSGPAGESSEGFAPGQIAISAQVSVTFELD